MKYLIAYILFVLTSVSAIAQVDVKGVVVDDENKEPLVGASIIIKDTDNKIKEGEDINKLTFSYSILTTGISICGESSNYLNIVLNS